MPRRPRVSTGGFVFHVLNRAAGRARLFDSEEDFLALETILEQARERSSTRLLSYCIMPNHWHLVLWPTRDGELSDYMRWVTVTHTQRCHAFHDTAGFGPLYQGRFKSFPVQHDEHLVTVCRYVERNPVRAGIVTSAAEWRWGSLWQRRARSNATVTLGEWPVDRPRRYVGASQQAANTSGRGGPRRIGRAGSTLRSPGVAGARG